MTCAKYALLVLLYASCAESRDLCNFWSSAQHWYKTCWRSGRTSNDFNRIMYTLSAASLRDYVNNLCSNVRPSILSCVQERIMEAERAGECSDGASVIDAVQRQTNLCSDETLIQHVMSEIDNVGTYDTEPCMGKYQPTWRCIMPYLGVSEWSEDVSLTEGLEKVESITRRYARCLRPRLKYHYNRTFPNCTVPDSELYTDRLVWHLTDMETLGGYILAEDFPE